MLLARFIGPRTYCPEEHLKRTVLFAFTNESMVAHSPIPFETMPIRIPIGYAAMVSITRVAAEKIEFIFWVP